MMAAKRSIATPSTCSSHGCFTKWATGALADSAVDVQLIEGCPVLDSGRYGGSLSPRFSLIAPAGSTDALAEWQRRIVPEEPEMQSCAEEMV